MILHAYEFVDEIALLIEGWKKIVGHLSRHSLTQAIYFFEKNYAALQCEIVIVDRYLKRII